MERPYDIRTPIDESITALFLAVMRQGRWMTSEPFARLEKALDQVGDLAIHVPEARPQYAALLGARDGLAGYYSEEAPSHRSDAYSWGNSETWDVARRLAASENRRELAAHYMREGYGQSLREAIWRMPYVRL